MRPRTLLRGLALALLAAALLAPAAAAFARPAPQEAKLRVVTKPVKPLVFKEGDRLSGFSIELWAEIARRLDLDYEWVEVSTVGEQLDAVTRGSGDVAIAAISMTAERETMVDFTHPFMSAGLQILSGNEMVLGLPGLIRSGLLPTLLTIAGLSLLILLLMAHMIWVVERRSNPAFPRAYLPGLWEAIWWSFTTLATGGYPGDRPPGPWRRLLVMFWMLLSVILIAQFTASVTSLLTVQQLSGTIAGPGDLPGKRVATVQGTTAARYLQQSGIGYTGVARIEDAYGLLKSKAVDAVVYDAPVLQYYASHEGDGAVRLAGPVFQEETYGIALPPGSPLRKRINEVLLQLRQDGTYDALYTRWFGAQQ